MIIHGIKLNAKQAKTLTEGVLHAKASHLSQFILNVVASEGKRNRSVEILSKDPAQLIFMATQYQAHRPDGFLQADLLSPTGVLIYEFK